MVKDEKAFKWIEDRLYELGEQQTEISKRWGVKGGAIVTRYIKRGPEERSHLSAKWTQDLAGVLQMDAEDVISRVRPSERLLQLDERRDIMAETPTEVIEAVAKVLRVKYETAFNRVSAAVNQVVAEEW